jgi:hypothetical protein
MTRQPGRAIGLVGTIGQIALGLFLLYTAYLYRIQLIDAALGLIVFPAGLLLWQQWRLRYTQEQLKATGPVGFAINFAAGLVLFLIPATRVATLLFYGLSLLLAAIRGYAGCEVLAISNWLLKRDDQVGCVVFSPIDAVEDRLTGKAG